MRASRLIIGCSLLCVAPAACSDTRDPAAPGGPSASVSWNPDNGNPRIIRFQDNTGFLLIDPVTDVFSIQSWGDGQLGCNAPPTLYSYEDAQGILHPDGQINVLEMGRGIYIAVFRGWSAWAATGLDCGDLFPRKVAEGSGGIVFTDNDYDAPFRDSHNSDAYGFTATGQLALVGGGKVAYTGVSRCEWDGDTGARARCTDRIDLR